LDLGGRIVTDGLVHGHIAQSLVPDFADGVASPRLTVQQGDIGHERISADHSLTGAVGVNEAHHVIETMQMQDEIGGDHDRIATASAEIELRHVQLDEFCTLEASVACGRHADQTRH
jgi:hypothetical protein